MWAPLEAAVSWTKLTFAEKIKLISQLNLCNQKAEKIQKAFSKGNYVVTYCSYSCLLSSLDMYSFLYCIFSRPSKHLAMHLNSLKRLGFFNLLHVGFSLWCFFLPWNHLAIHLNTFTITSPWTGRQVRQVLLRYNSWCFGSVNKHCMLWSPDNYRCVSCCSRMVHPKHLASSSGIRNYVVRTYPLSWKQVVKMMVNSHLFF